MKNYHFFAVLAVLIGFTAVSCQITVLDQQEVPSQDEPRYVTFTCNLPEPDTKVAVSALGKTTWEEGDKIHIHTGHIKSGEYTTVTLTAGDIFNEGKSATITFPELTPYDYSGWGSGYATYYAAYPADATGNPTSCYCRNYFSDTNNILMAACDNAGTFSFYNLCGLISFSVDGDFDSYLFFGNNSETVGYTTYAVEILPASQNYMYSATTGAMSKISGTLNAGTNYIGIPNGANLTGGFTIQFLKGGEIQQYVIGSTPINIPKGNIVPLGNVTSKLKTYVAPSHSSSIPIAEAIDLSSSETANCYIIDNYASSGSKVYKFKAVKGNSNATLGTLSDDANGASVIWETHNDANSISAGSVIAAADYEYDSVADCDYIYFKMPETPTPGNAVIAAKNPGGTIVWSWHIWVPETTITASTYGGIVDSPMMSRNLGALIDASASEAMVDIKSFGLFYCWGRKDPFLCPGSVGSSTAAKSTGTFSMEGAQMTVEEAIHNPTTYVKTGSDDIKDWTTESSTSLWSSTKTIYDPCPPHYKVSPRNTSYPLWSSPNTAAGYELNTTNRWIKMGVTYDDGNPTTTGFVVFPIAGYIDQGAIKTSTRTYLWSSYASSSTIAYLLLQDGSSVSITQQRKSRAGSVRCVAE